MVESVRAADGGPIADGVEVERGAPVNRMLALAASLALLGFSCGGGGEDGIAQIGGGEEPDPGGEEPDPGGEDPGQGGGDGGNDGGPQFPLTQGLTVAQVSLPQPALDEFVLRATLPIPTGVYPTTANTSPFAVLDYDGTPVPAQTEIVSRYADLEDGADVVEVIALVESNPAVPTGQQVAYEIVLADHYNPDAPVSGELTDLTGGNEYLPSSVVQMLDTAGSILLVSEDVFGNVYVLDPLHGSVANEWMKFGHTMGELRTYGWMEPETGGSGPANWLPHLFGVHAYVSAWAGEELIGLDLRFNNGADGHDKGDPIDDPLGKLYFKYIHLVVPNGWFVQGAFEDPFFRDAYVSGDSTVFPLVDANDDGSLHMMPAAAQTERRLMLSPLGNQDRSRAFLEGQGLAFVQPGEGPGGSYEYWSWWNENTARYLPQRHVLPTLGHLGGSVAAELAGEYNWLNGFFSTGTGYGAYPVEKPRMGWAHPYGVGYGGMTGGDEVFASQGVRIAWAASTSGYRRLQMMHRMHTDRMPDAYYQKNGDSTSIEEWLQPNPGGPGPYIPMIWYMGLLIGDPMGYDTAPTFQIDQVAALGAQPDYEGDLLSFAMHDLEHLSRYTHCPKALAWLGNDSLAKDDLIHQAEMFQLTYNEFYNDPWGNESEGGLRADRSYVDARPGTGYPTGRAEGWGIDAMNCAYALADPSWRANKHAWYDFLSDVIADGQASCSGFLQAYVHDKFLGGKYRGRQSIEVAIMENAILGTVESVYRGRSGAHVGMLEDVLEDSFYAMINAESWQPGVGGAWIKIAVGPLDLDAPPFCGYVPPDGQDAAIDSWQTPGSLAYAYGLTGDPAFLVYAEYLAGSPLLGALQAAGTENIWNRAPLLAVAQGQ